MESTLGERFNGEIMGFWESGCRDEYDHGVVPIAQESTHLRELCRDLKDELTSTKKRLSEVSRELTVALAQLDQVRDILGEDAWKAFGL